MNDLSPTADTEVFAVFAEDLPVTHALLEALGFAEDNAQSPDPRDLFIITTVFNAELAGKRGAPAEGESATSFYYDGEAMAGAEVDVEYGVEVDGVLEETASDAHEREQDAVLKAVVAGLLDLHQRVQTLEGASQLQQQINEVIHMNLGTVHDSIDALENLAAAQETFNDAVTSDIADLFEEADEEDFEDAPLVSQSGTHWDLRLPARPLDADEMFDFIADLRLLTDEALDAGMIDEDTHNLAHDLLNGTSLREDILGFTTEDWVEGLDVLGDAWAEAGVAGFASLMDDETRQRAYVQLLVLTTALSSMHMTMQTLYDAVSQPD